MGGNHDYWLGDFLRDEAGLRISRHPLEVELAGRRLFLIHGDGLAGRRDRGYRMLRRVIRHPVSETLYRLLHPDLGFALARRFSQLSRSVADPDRRGQRSCPVPAEGAPCPATIQWRRRQAICGKGAARALLPRSPPGWRPGSAHSSAGSLSGRSIWSSRASMRRPWISTWSTENTSSGV